MSQPNHVPGRCRALTKAGEPCSVAATASGLCYLNEDPKRAAEMGRRGGLQNRRVVPDETTEMSPLNTADDVRRMLAKLALDVRARRVEPKVAASVSQIASTLLKAIETAELEQRLSKLEGKDAN